MARVIYNRLLPIVESATPLAVMISAHPFHTECNKEVSLATDVLNSGGCCAVLILDVKNAFNIANWSQIKGALANIGDPRHLATFVENHLSKRTLCYGEMKLLGPLLWNGMYNGVLGLPVPEKAAIVRFVDDLAIVFAAKHTGEIYAAETVRVEKPGWKMPGWPRQMKTRKRS